MSSSFLSRARRSNGHYRVVKYTGTSQARLHLLYKSRTREPSHPWRSLCFCLLFSGYRGRFTHVTNPPVSPLFVRGNVSFAPTETSVADALRFIADSFYLAAERILLVYAMYVNRLRILYFCELVRSQTRLQRCNLNGSVSCSANPSDSPFLSSARFASRVYSGLLWSLLSNLGP